MGKLGSQLGVLLAVVLVAVSYPTPLSSESLGRSERDREAMAPASPATSGTPNLEATATSAAPVIATPGSWPTPAAGSLATPVPTPVDARAALAKLRARSEAAPAASGRLSVELPRRIRIPAIGVDAGFEFVGLGADGAMDVPKDPARVAWYQLGPRPGEPGNAVVAGHVDWGGKTAVFWRLRELKPGDAVEVVAADERSYRFVVQSQRSFDADRAPVDEVFGQSDATEVTLITCGGDFDRNTRQYPLRLVVRGVLQ